jgi:8-oxo-dGTP pyrophosphatase MutT (NUDIX family)
MGKDKRKENLKREFSAGGVVFKKKGKEIYWLLINPKGTARWQFPKGLIEKNETSSEGALREVGEEGGVKAKIIEKLADLKLFYFWEGKRIFKIVTYYLMEYVSEAEKEHNGEVEETEFFPHKEALEKLTFKNDKETLKKAFERVKQGVQASLV